MLVNTHGEIANLIFKHLSRNNHCHLSRFSFITGNIKPDLVKELRKESHYYEDAIFYVLDKVQQLEDLTLTKEEFSTELGVICHFLSDFFCRYHQKDFQKKNIVDHILYEMNLHFKFSKMLKKNLDIISGRYDYLYTSDLKKMIVAMHQEYVSGKSTYEDDILYALKCTLMVSGKLEYDYRCKNQKYFQEYVYA